MWENIQAFIGCPIFSHYLTFNNFITTCSLTTETFRLLKKRGGGDRDSSKIVYKQTGKKKK